MQQGLTSTRSMPAGVGLIQAWMEAMGQGETVMGDIRPHVKGKWDLHGESMGSGATMMLPALNLMGEMEVPMWS